MGLCLTHDVQSTHTAGLRTGICLFDISGFFDNVNHPRLVQLISDLGFSPEIVNWSHSFLEDRRVCLRFNGILSDPMETDSPISPILFIIYTSPLLHKVRNWTRATLGMYIDNGVLFACSDQWSEVSEALSSHYTDCVDWLTRAGLLIEPDKTELMFFRCRCKQLPPLMTIHLRILTEATYYQVKATTNVRYLSFFIDHKLNWTRHMDIMCNRAHASLRALQLLGNSVCGIDFTQWRLAYNAICLPVLTYSCQLWYMGKQVTLV